MNNKNLFATGAVALLLPIATLTAHHSLQAQFDTRSSIELTGIITGMDWINPHSYLHLDVPGEDGSVVSWNLEALPIAMLRKAGLTKELLIGDGRPVTVQIHTARDGTHNLGYTLKITYADGHYYQLGVEER